MAAEPVLIRSEIREDHDSVEALLERAFQRPDEAGLVRRVRDADPRVISLVATTADHLVGHILFTPVTLEGQQNETLLMGLGPMAVDPAQQKQGIGSALAREGIEACRTAGASLLFVLGHAEYYPRFGFRPAPVSGFHYKSEDFDPHFMVLELAPVTLQGGMVRYLPAFDGV